MSGFVCKSELRMKNVRILQSYTEHKEFIWMNINAFKVAGTEISYTDWSSLLPNVIWMMQYYDHIKIWTCLQSEKVLVISMENICKFIYHGS
jgi:hypothetical protein